MNRRWKFTDLEFFALWEGMQDGVLPAPFVFASDIPLYRDFVRAKELAGQRLRSEIGYVADDLVQLVARPDVRIVVRGRNEHDPQDPRSQIRILAVRRAARALLISQRPGESIDTGNGFTVVEQHISELSQAIVSALPGAPAGRREEFVLTGAGGSAANYDYTYAQPIHRATDNVIDRAADDFRCSAVDSAGSIEVCQGVSVFGPRGTSRYRSGWRDLVGDGRYLVTPGPPVTATPVDRRRMVDSLDRVVAEVVRALEEEPVE